MAPIDKSRYTVPSPHESDEGKLIGRDPRKVDTKDLVALGGPTSPMKAIRRKCVDCCSGVDSEVRKCVAVTCVLWPFRMGKNPFFNKLKDLDVDDDQAEDAPEDSAWE